MRDSLAFAYSSCAQWCGIPHALTSGMSLILLAAAINRVMLSEQDAYLALSEAAMWLVLILVLGLTGRRS